MARHAQKAFTLVELLVVVSIIALLVTMLMPTFTRAIELSRRASCKVNLREIPRACKMYAMESRLHRGGTPQALPNSGPTSGNWHSGAGANRESLWKLVSLRYLSPGSLVCTSVQDDQKDSFASGDPSAYAYLTMVGRTVTLKNVYTSIVIVADRNPRFAPNSKAVIGGMEHQNSLSHRIPGYAAEGQNVGRLDESVQWLDIPKVATGSNTQDWIYESTNPGGDGKGTAGHLSDVLLLN